MKMGFIISEDTCGGSILGDQILKFLGEGMGCLGGYSVHEWILVECIADEQILCSFVCKVISGDVLPDLLGCPRGALAVPAWLLYA